MGEGRGGGAEPALRDEVIATKIPPAYGLPPYQGGLGGFRGVWSQSGAQAHPTGLLYLAAFVQSLLALG